MHRSENPEHKKHAEAKAKDLLNDPHVKSAYLGTGAHEVFD